MERLEPEGTGLQLKGAFHLNAMPCDHTLRVILIKGAWKIHVCVLA